MTDSFQISSRRPLRVAIIGMGGFAAAHHSVLWELEKQGLCRVVATCDPNPEKFDDLRSEYDLCSRNIAVHNDYLAMLDAHRDVLDFVTIPTPIPLHAAMHRACVDRGIPCYLEKPPTLFWEEMEEMLHVEESARKQTQVGFAYILEKPRQELKRRLIGGDFGRLKRVGFVGQWPRNTAYYERASWAGRLQLDGRLVLDSCIGNAMSHYIHNILFWCGQDAVMAWAEVEKMEAELYRARNIENFDTCFARGFTSSGIEISLAATHLGEPPSSQVEWLECEKASIRYVNNEKTIRYHIAWNDGREESHTHIQENLLAVNIRHYIEYLRSETGQPATRLVDSRPFVHLTNLIYIAAGAIHSIDESYVTHAGAEPNEGTWVRVEEMEAALTEFLSSGIMPGENGTSWGMPGGSASIDRLSSLTAVINQLNKVPTSF